MSDKKNPTDGRDESFRITVPNGEFVDGMPDPTEDMIRRDRSFGPDAMSDPMADFEGRTRNPNRRGDTQPIEIGLEETRRLALARLETERGEHISADRLGEVPTVPENWQNVLISTTALTKEQRRDLFQEIKSLMPKVGCEMKYDIDSKIIGIFRRSEGKTESPEELGAMRDKIQSIVNLVSQDRYHTRSVWVKVDASKLP